MPSTVTTNPDGSITMVGTGTFALGGAPVIQSVSLQTVVLPGFGPQEGRGRLVHPMIGAYDYVAKPDEWVNLMDDVVVPPVWAATRTIGGGIHSLWRGYIRDVVVEERWKSLGGLSMPIGQLRTLVNMWTHPPIPESQGYVKWYPTYATSAAFTVLIVSVKSGDGGIVLDDVIHAKGLNQEEIGWVTGPVTLTMKIVGRA